MDEDEAVKEARWIVNLGWALVNSLNLGLVNVLGKSSLYSYQANNSCANTTDLFRHFITPSTSCVNINHNLIKQKDH